MQSENTFAIAIYFQSNANRKIGVAEIQSILPTPTHTRSVQRMLKQLADKGYIESDNAQPKGYTYRNNKDNLCTQP